MVRILKSIPIVVMNEGVKESSLNLSRQHDFPTPESPINRSLICCLVSMACSRVLALDSRETHKEIVVPCSSHSGIEYEGGKGRSKDIGVVAGEAEASPGGRLFVIVLRRAVYEVDVVWHCEI